MNIIKKLYSQYGAYFLLSILGLVVIYPILINYRFVKDDTCNVVVFYEMLNQFSGPRLLSYLGTNEWLGYQPRSFFLTWWIQAGLIKLFGMRDLLNAAELPFAIFAGTIHLINGLMIFRLGKKYLTLNSAILASLGYLVLPWATIDYLVSNNWFFLLPLFFYLLFVNCLIALKPLQPFSIIMLSLLLLCTMFSGEQMLAVPYVIGITLSSYIYFAMPRSVQVKKFQIQSILIYTFGVLAFLFYSKVIVNNPSPSTQAEIWKKNIFDIVDLVNANTPIILLNYIFATKEYTLKFLTFNSPLFGGVGYTGVSITLSLVFGLGSFLLIFGAATNQSFSSDLNARNFFGVKFAILVAGLFATMLPMFFGALTGARPGPDDRYLLVPSLFIFLILVLLIDYSKLNLGYKKIISLLVVMYFGFITFHISWDVWRTQSAIDARLWGAVMSAIEKNAKYILTINNDPYEGHRGLERPYLSIAWTDFQADWGAKNRLRYSHGYDLKFIQYIEEGSNGEVWATNYWGERIKTNRNEIQVIYLNDSNKLLDSLNGPLQVLDLDAYFKYARDGSIPNRIIQKQGP